MTAKELLISIKTLFDGKGSAEAQRQLDATGKKAAEAGKKSADGFLKAGKGAQLFEKTMGNLNKVMTGFGILGIIGVLMQLWNMLKKVSEWIGDKMTAAVRAAGAAAEEMADKLSSSKLEEAGRLISNITDGFNRVEKAISAAHAAQSQLSDAWRDLNKAGQEATDMELERREKAELARLDQGDETGRTRVTNKYAAIRAENSLARRQADYMQAEQAAAADISAASSRRMNAQSGLEKMELTKTIMEDQLSYSQDTLSRLTPLPGEKLSDQDEKARQRAAEEVANFTDKIAALNRTIDDTTAILEAAKTAERSGELRLMAARVRSTQGYSAAEALTAQDTSDLARETERVTAEAKYRDRISSATERAKTLASSYDTRADVFRAQADASDPQRRNFGSRDSFMRATAEDRRLEKAAVGAEKQSEAVNKLLAQLERTPPEKIAALLGGIESQLRAFESSIRNAEQRSRRQ